MAPRFRSKAPKGPVTPLYDAKRDKATDPQRLAYILSEEAARVLSVIVRAGKPIRTDGYVARHLTEKGLVKREKGRDAKYRSTLRGEAVIEILKTSKRFPHLFPTES